MKKNRYLLLAILILSVVLIAACNGNIPVENTSVENAPIENASADNEQVDSDSGETIPVEIDTAPDFTLPDKDGNMVNLEEVLQKYQYVVLVFYYEHRCTTCMVQLREIEADTSKYEDVKAKVIAIAVQSETGAEISTRISHAQFPILADKDHTTAEAYGVYDGTSSTPSVFIINQALEVVWGRISVIPVGCGEHRVPSQMILEILST